MKSTQDKDVKRKPSPLKIVAWLVLLGIIAGSPCVKRGVSNLYNNAYKQVYSLLHPQKKEISKTNYFYTVEQAPIDTSNTIDSTYALNPLDTIPRETAPTKTPEQGQKVSEQEEGCSYGNPQIDLTVRTRNKVDVTFGGVRIYKITAEGDTILETIAVPPTTVSEDTTIETKVRTGN